ncbi:adenylyl-sulfate kinase [Dermacoccus profundi]|uniref:Adenylyl-sulfate kinase n=2 Tax=Dermacoccus TaxID=57495 RepID=A0A417Z909_9MICO|nr:adenylyl-sulfate kinase [Dermacoccus abyssi]
MRDQPVSVATVWLTGLSGAGKSTIAHELVEALRARGERVELLDGDELRESLSKGLGFSREDRTTHVTRVGFLADMLARNGVWAVVPVIAPYADAREQNRARHEASGARYVEVHVATSLEECARRDVKGLYAKARAGEIPAMTGVDDPYEIPEDPDLRLETEGRSVRDSAAEVLALLLPDESERTLS